MRGSEARRLLLSCEHGGHDIPAAWAPLFRGHDRLRQSHRGWDPGALILARQLARSLKAPLVAARISRLLVDLNRSPGHPAQFSSVTRHCPAEVRDQIAARWHRPYREQVTAAVARALRNGGTLLHLSVHSFTPRLNGETRRADVGLLYDPARPAERRLCRQLKARLRDLAPSLRVRCNYPYRGTSDGLTKTLRGQFPDPRYAGVELEINQRHAARPAREWAALRRVLVQAVHDCLGMA